jgi:thiamine biosynthesis lipoprotein
MNSIRLFKTLGWSLLLLMVISAYAAPQKQEAPLTRFDYERPEMGVAFRIVLYAADQSTADRAADAAFRRIQELNDIMSDYEPDSDRVARCASATTFGSCSNARRRWPRRARGPSM